jgi:ABC-type branched-subunit amino acid transport system substrate-binding protein/outer membrane protein assembly factor BamD (BamD/ComL family)
MPKGINRIIFALVLLTLMIASVWAERAPKSSGKGFADALEVYNLGNYDESYRQFDQLAKANPQDEKLTIFRFMAAKSLYLAGQYDKANSDFIKFIGDFPTSTYIGAAYLYLGHIAYKQGKFEEAARSYIKTYEIEPSRQAGLLAAENLRLMLQAELTATELTSLLDSFPNANLSGDIQYYLAKRLLGMKEYRKAGYQYESYLRYYPEGKYVAEARQENELANTAAEEKIMIGVLAPLTGSYADFGVNLVAGVKLVFDGHSKINGKKIEILVKDTGGLPVQATMALQEIIEEDPVAVIGPLRSESAVSAAVVASYNKIPLITPTASEKGITSLGDNIYQLSPPAEKIAQALAEYAVTEMGIKEFGIISPGDFSSRQISKSFTQKVYELGGEVVATSFYESGQTDFANQIRPLRDVLLMKTEEQITGGLLDSLVYYDTLNQVWLEQKDWPVSLGGLFLPGYIDDLAMLAPQIKYNVIATRYFGLYGWDSPKLLGRIGSYIEGAVFATDYHQGSSGIYWSDFNAKFREKYKRESDRVSALAYDAAGLLKQGIEGGAYSPKAMNTFLSGVEKYNGASSLINFKNSEHSNDAVSIYLIRNGALEKVK